MKQIDFSKLSLIELLDLAIVGEEEAAQRYGEFADQMDVHHNLKAGQLFREIQMHELDHMKTLRTKRDRLSDQPVTIEPLHFFDAIEAPGYEKVHYKMTPRHIFEVALEAEESAVAFYEKLTKILNDAEAKEVAAEFLEEERGHVARLQQALAEQKPLPEDWEEDHDAPAVQA